eukprot:NODE_1257_length_1191_cov_428.841549.p1 GENE.NODE_1257_length_1191_cov_428.841549~~NODE_1257_length_1191_cov_428.841549.p1  ORF type:complete len:313 (+),score=114.21 NODE_1257_length_1191_cov_428.841549:128-940(+)
MLRAALERDRAKLEAERHAMQVFNKEPDELITVNAGGTIFRVRRSTLCQVEGSVLAAMFSGRWDQSLTYDEEGAVFVDSSPAVFEAVLSHFRALGLDPRAEAPQVTPSLRAELAAFREFMMLDAPAGEPKDYIVVEVHRAYQVDEAGHFAGVATAEQAQRILRPEAEASAHGHGHGRLMADSSEVLLRFPVPCVATGARLQCWSGLMGGDPVEWAVSHLGAVLGRCNFATNTTPETFTLTFDEQHRLGREDTLTLTLDYTGVSFRDLSFF